MIILGVRAGGIQRRPGADPWIRNSIPLLTFVTLGLPAGAIGVAWPYMRASFGAPLAGLGPLLAALTPAAFFAGAASGPPTRRRAPPGPLVGGCGLRTRAVLGPAPAPAWWSVPLGQL